MCILETYIFSSVPEQSSNNYRFKHVSYNIKTNIHAQFLVHMETNKSLCEVRSVTRLNRGKIPALLSVPVN
jgi:hypothetical protein